MTFFNDCQPGPDDETGLAPAMLLNSLASVDPCNDFNSRSLPKTLQKKFSSR